MLFSIEHEYSGIIVKVGFFKFKFRDKIKQPKLEISDIKSHIMASKVNQNLAKYRGIYKDKSILIVGGGSSLQYLDTIPENCIKIGINRAYKLENIKFDYIFLQDYFLLDNDRYELSNYRINECKKIIGIHTSDTYIRIKPETFNNIENAEFCVLNNRRPNRTNWPVDISVEPFAYFSGTVFLALQFALFTSAKNIYLAGFDCNNSHSFETNKKYTDLSHQYPFWHDFKKYKDFMYPNINIISINPVRLKGLFIDTYTDSFLNKNA